MGVDNTIVARRYFTELWGKGNLALLEELVDDQIVLRDPMTPELKGIENLKARLEEMDAMFSDGSVTVDEIIPAGDRVIVRATWRGVHRGDFFGVKNTGRTVTVPSAEILRLANGKVVENISYMDMYTMFQQLGMLPSPDQLGAALSSKGAPAVEARS